MKDVPDYQEYLERHDQCPGSRKGLDRSGFERLTHEYDRLKRRLDPDDIQLDEWKRLDELKFLLILADEEDQA